MLIPCRARLSGGLLLVALVLMTAAPEAAFGRQPKTLGQNITTFDGVELSATLYPNPGGKRDAVVVLLHDIDMKKGGASEQQGWTDLAVQLQKDGYVVLTFDFRGFGDSKAVNADKFWTYPHNGRLNLKGKSGRASIDYREFNPAYVQYLVNDIAAVKAYLDRRNDARALNASNTILIGAGEGATLGAMFVANETRRAKDKAKGIGVPVFGDPEVKDLAACVWLNIKPKRYGTTQITNATLARWLAEPVRHYKVPMLFVYGKGDTESSSVSDDILSKIKGGSKKLDTPTKAFPVPNTKLRGPQLLDKGLPTANEIVDVWLKDLMKERKSREQIERKPTDHGYVYLDTTGKFYKVNKPVNQEVGEVNIPFLLEMARRPLKP